MSIGVFTPPAVMENVTNTWFHGFGSVEGGLYVGGVLDGGPGRQPMGKKCVDLHKRLIEHGVHFVPGPDECTLCACDDGEPKWCKPVLCSPPTDCKSFRVGASCCDFICMDNSLNQDGPRHGGPYQSRPVEIANLVPKAVIVAVSAVLLLLVLLFFLIRRLRQRHSMQGWTRSSQCTQDEVNNETTGITIDNVS